MDEARHQWRVSDGQLLTRREWDGEGVLFNDLSGATHLLSSTAIWLLEQLAVTSADLPSLASALQAELAAEAVIDLDDAADTSVDQEQLADLVADLHSLNLIEPC